MAELEDLRATLEHRPVQYHWAEHWPHHDTCLEGVTSNPGAGERAKAALIYKSYKSVSLLTPLRGCQRSGGTLQS